MTPGQLAVIAAQIAAARSTSAALLTQAAAASVIADALQALVDADAPPPPPPTYALTAAPTGVDEGHAIVFTLVTTGVPAGTAVPYRLEGSAGGADIGAAMVGVFEVGADGTATLTVPTVADLLTEGDETLQMVLDLPGVDASASATIRDTSAAPPPPPIERIPVRGPNLRGLAPGDPNNFDNGKVDYIDISNLPPPVPWTLYLGPDQELAPSRNGVESIGTWQRWHLYGAGQNLYLPLPRVWEGGLPAIYPDIGSSPESAAAFLRTRMGSRIFVRDGARGESIPTPYTTWHGHTRREGSVVHTSPAIPMWIGIEAHGRIVYAMRDGSMKEGGWVPVESWANDFSYYEPERKIFFYTDTGKGRVLRVDRRTDPWTITTLAEGFGDCTSVRAIGPMVYVADSKRGEVWEVDARTGAKRKVCGIPNCFWLDYTSTGQLVVATRTRAVYFVDVATGTVSAERTPGTPKSGALQDWVTVDVDRHGVMGEVDAFCVLSVVGAANVDFYRISGNSGAQIMPNHGKETLHNGPVRNVGDTFGHYPWVGAHHPDEAALMVQGTANAVPQILVVCPPGRAWVGMDNPDKYNMFTGYQIALNGDEVRQPLLGRYTPFLPQMGFYGEGLVSADHLGLMTPAKVVEFIRGGMLGTQPRAFTKEQVKSYGMRLLLNSQQYLIEGWPLIARYRAYCDTLEA